jgi:hypothetical protein
MKTPTLNYHYALLKAKIVETQKFRSFTASSRSEKFRFNLAGFREYLPGRPTTSPVATILQTVCSVSGKTATLCGVGTAPQAGDCPGVLPIGLVFIYHKCPSRGFGA